MTQRWDLMKPEEREGKTYWYRVGVVFENKNGDGLSLIIPEGVSISGKVCAFVPKSKDDYANDQRKAQGRPSRQEERRRDSHRQDDNFGDDDIPF